MFRIGNLAGRPLSRCRQPRHFLRVEREGRSEVHHPRSHEGGKDGLEQGRFPARLPRKKGISRWSCTPPGRQQAEKGDVAVWKEKTTPIVVAAKAIAADKDTHKPSWT